MRKWGTDKAVVYVSVYSSIKRTNRKKSQQNFLIITHCCQNCSTHSRTAVRTAARTHARYHTLSVGLSVPSAMLVVVCDIH